MPAKCLWGNCTLCKGSKDAAGVTLPKSRKYAAQQWIINSELRCEINEFSFGSNCVVCERHFDLECFTEDSYVKMCEALVKKPRYTKTLKPDAVPAVFLSHDDDSEF